MDCSLSTWPSITQFDDFSWAGLGDIDPLESLDRSLDSEPESSLPNSQESKPSVSASAIPCSDTSAHIPQMQTSDLYRLASSDSLLAARWESINSVDLAAVLDSTFPSNGDTSTPSGEDVYDLYTDSVLNDVDTLMSDSVSEVAEEKTPFYSLDVTPMDANLLTPEAACPLEDVECGNGVIDDESPRSINISHVSTSKPVEMRADLSALNADIFDNRGGVSTNMVQTLPFNPSQPPISGDPCTSSQCVMDLKESMFPLRPSYMMPWPKAQFTSGNSQLLEREKVMHSSTLRYGDSYPAIVDPHTMMADAATVELKRNRAQASRARRVAANQRRAKKYPLQKLIRMSSSPTSTRDRLEQNLVGSVPTTHQPVHMVLPSQYPGGVQSLPRSALNTQTASLIPVLQSPRVTSSVEVLSQANSVHGGPFYSYQQTLMAPTEDNRVSSGGGAKLSMCTDQDVQSLSSSATPAFPHSASFPQGLDAALLEQLQSILCKMNVNVRLCIRDALYRLANSAKHRQSKNDDTASDSSSSISKESMETNTNSLDRWIVNILFCKQPSSSEWNSELHSTDSAHDPHQFMQNYNTSSSSQQWNSCGSSVNLQEQPLCVLTGL